MMLDLHVPVEEILGLPYSSTTGEVNIKTSELSPSLNHTTQPDISQESKTSMDSADLHFLNAIGDPSPVHPSIGPGALSGKKQQRSDESTAEEIPINKCHKVDVPVQGNNFLGATEGTILEWLRTQDGVSCALHYTVEKLLRVLLHFS